MRPGRLNVTFRQVEGYIDRTMFPAYRVRYDIEDQQEDDVADAVANVPEANPNRVSLQTLSL